MTEPPRERSERRQLIATTFALILAQAALAQPITPIADVVAGEAVAVHGVVAGWDGTGALALRDDSGTVRVRLGPRPPVQQPGQRLTVRGRVEHGGAIAISARELVLASGELVILAPDQP